MEATVEKIEQLTHEPTGNAMPKNKITISIEIDTTPLDEAQKKADKLKATLPEVQELIRKTNSTQRGL